jgi:hypothetical protein
VRAKGAVRTVRVAYAVPVGTSVRLVERGKGINHTIAAHLRGRRCAGLPRMRPGTDEKILCANIRFRPSHGPGGKREVQAVVTRGAIPLLQKNIASFRAPRQTLPSRVGKLRARRRHGSLVVAFRGSHGASRYSVSAKLADGRELAFDLGGDAARCVSQVSRSGSLLRSRSRECATTSRWAARGRSRSGPISGQLPAPRRSGARARSAPDAALGNGSGRSVGRSPKRAFGASAGRAVAFAAAV